MTAGTRERAAVVLLVGVLMVVALVVAAVTAFVGGYAVEPPSPFVYDGDPCCGHPDTYREVALAFVPLAIGGAVVGGIAAYAVSAISGRERGGPRRWTGGPAVGAGLAVAVALVAQVVQRADAVRLPGCDEVRQASFAAGGFPTRRQQFGLGRCDVLIGLTIAEVRERLGPPDGSFATGERDLGYGLLTVEIRDGRVVSTAFPEDLQQMPGG